MNERNAIQPSLAPWRARRRLATARDGRRRLGASHPHPRSPVRGCRIPGVVWAALGILSGCGVRQAAPDPDIPATTVSVPFVSLARMQNSNLANEARMVVRTRAEWEDLWAAATDGLEPTTGAPPVDFSRRMVLVAAMGGRATGGFEVRFESVSEDRERLYAVVAETSPGAGCLTTQGFTAPVSAISVPLSGKPVNFVRRAKTLSCGGAP